MFLSLQIVHDEAPPAIEGTPRTLSGRHASCNARTARTWVPHTDALSGIIVAVGVTTLPAG